MGLQRDQAFAQVVWLTWLGQVEGGERQKADPALGRHGAA